MSIRARLAVVACVVTVAALAVPPVAQVPTADAHAFVVFGRVVAGLDVMDALHDGYGESALGGIRAGKQDVLFTQGNAYLRKHFPMLDYIRKATVE